MVSAARSQAIYHAVAQRMTAETPDTVILVRPCEPYLCLGWHDVMPAVLDAEACARGELPILRRRLGGGTTYLDASQPFYQFVFHHSRVPALARDLYARLLAVPVMALRQIGYAAMLRDMNEIEVDGCRIAGVGGGRIGEAAVVVGNILCDFDYGVLPRIWNAPWPRFRLWAAQALRERVTTLHQLGWRGTPDMVTAAVKACLAPALNRPVHNSGLDPGETALASRLERHLADPAFLSLHAERGTGPMRKLKIAAGVFIHGETITLGTATARVTLRERDGVIERAAVEDGGEEPAPWVTGLTGTPVAGWRERLAALWCAAPRSGARLEQ
jgi:lipoate-protein ligase A